jgi:RHS repeat-associated protein
VSNHPRRYYGTSDDLNRLVCAGIPVCPHDSSQTQGYTYDYDQFGNRWHQTLTAGTGVTLNLTFTNGRNQVDGVGYDAAGNMTNNGSFTYNADGRLTNDNVYGLSYDAAGNMVEEKNLSTGSTLDYVFQGTHEITAVDGNGVDARGEVYAQGWHVNTYANGDTLFAHDDQIGTTHVRTDHTGAIAQHCANDPFGTYSLSCGGAWESDIYYTGQLELNDGMIVFPARSFHSQTGRFMVPDPAGMAAADPGNPQTWNRYAYVTNSPVSFTDPLGLNKDEIFSGFCDASCGGGGFSGGTDANGMSWGFGPGSFGGSGNPYGLPSGANGLLNAQNAWLGSGSIPWYSVQGGDLMLLVDASSKVDEDDGVCPPEMAGCNVSGAIVKQAGWWDLGSLSSGVSSTPFSVSGYVPFALGYGGYSYTFTHLAGKGQPTYNCSTHAGTISTFAAKAVVSGGPLTLLGRTTPNAANVISSWGWNLSLQALPWLGYQVNINSSGVVGGFTFGIPGASASYGWGSCKTGG